jgi:uncharacterized protein YggT (Ycf19 family)
MGYSLVAISMMILYALALIYREIFSKVLGVFFYMFLHYSFLVSWISPKGLGPIRTWCIFKCQGVVDCWLCWMDIRLSCSHG